MKKIFFCLAIIIAAKTLTAKTTIKFYIPPIHSDALLDTTSYPLATLSAVNWTFYVNKPINTLLADLNNLFPGYALGRVYPADRMVAGRINIYYGNGIYLMLSVSQFQYINPVNHDSAGWDATLFCQENLGRIQLWNNDVNVYDSGL